MAALCVGGGGDQCASRNTFIYRNFSLNLILFAINWPVGQENPVFLGAGGIELKGNGLASRRIELSYLYKILV